DRVDRDVRHLEQHAVAGQLGQRRGGAAEPDVQQLDQRVVLDRRQLHGVLTVITRCRTAPTCADWAGLLMKPDAPAALTTSREEVSKSADITSSRTAGSSPRSLA